MTPAHTDSPLRRSEAGAFRDGVQNVLINDDEEERRQARRRTLLRESGASTTLEESETLKKCLEIYNGNKLSKDNAWSLSLIDTLSTLMDKHHKSMNNFKVAGSSLEASSKVYGLRVDSIHTDVLRMSAGLNAHKYSNKTQGQDDDDVSPTATEANEAGDQDAENPTEAASAPKPVKPKRTRKQVSTVTKNKETLNARLDTVPLTDPVFGKLNSIVGSINSSNRLLNNILPSMDSELRLRLDFQFWDSSSIEAIDYTEVFELTMEPTKPCEKLVEINFEDLKMRPMHSGYVISDTPEDIDEEADKENRVDSPSGVFEDDFNHELAFDINADVEPIPLTGPTTTMVDVDFGEFEELTNEERGAINQCRGLRKAAVLIEDLRPVDASSKLEYSYRPLDKISQFWAGPSHWKFKKPRARSSVIDPHRFSQQPVGNKQNNARSRAKQRQSKHVNFGEFHDDLFVKLDEKFKSRKTNVQKKWDARKLKLPTDLQIDPNMFYKFRFAPGIPVEEDAIESQTPTLQTEPVFDVFDGGEPHHGDDDNLEDDAAICSMNPGGFDLDAGADHDTGNPNATFMPTQDGDADQTILEIATDFEGAPNQVTKIIVPFAKRAKVIDMKNLKKCCTHLMRNQMSKEFQGTIPELAIPKDEEYAPGMASFQEIYTHLPEVLTTNMAEALSPSVAFYSILHLANDLNLRLIPQADLNDFKIRQVL
ncbi:condensin complex subunit 2 [Eupeodes corollae]|uniref:condensin complex subunit 2 n=1 Tax=Eupeodes corollae TaxID=290404 RepID=UPI002492C02F|nr:condensin complex subunit 2 [Eupeodes corollae]XP_055903544.1 condensin complex subunit 2 [Eupeodes corollae]XP_055903545.1 condensin complex subunit 2 [Eupeodes corollae]